MASNIQRRRFVAVPNTAASPAGQGLLPIATGTGDYEWQNKTTSSLIIKPVSGTPLVVRNASDTSTVAEVTDVGTFVNYGDGGLYINKNGTINASQTAGGYLEVRGELKIKDVAAVNGIVFDNEASIVKINTSSTDGHIKIIGGSGSSAALDCGGKRIQNVMDPQLDQDAVTKKWYYDELTNYNTTTILPQHMYISFADYEILPPDGYTFQTMFSSIAGHWGTATWHSEAGVGRVSSVIAIGWGSAYLQSSYYKIRFYAGDGDGAGGTAIMNSPTIVLMMNSSNPLTEVYHSYIAHYGEDSYGHRTSLGKSYRIRKKSTGQIVSSVEDPALNPFIVE